MRGGNVLTDTLVLSDADRVALRLRSLRDLRRAVIVQGASMVFAALLCWIGFGGQAGASALAGAAAYWVPNTLLALRLMLGIWMRRSLSPLAFLLGEMLKLGLVVMLLAGMGLAWHDWLVWPAVLFGLLCVLKGYVLVLLLGK